ncbi:unnamed protein product [Calicophoron daubneyi]|uniref:PRORP domain-containing protein n=1 Tax=Calicophoron daubneyi TaxID=300641 RepID=A0AAV2SZ99_CALDB
MAFLIRSFLRARSLHLIMTSSFRRLSTAVNLSDFLPIITLNRPREIRETFGEMSDFSPSLSVCQNLDELLKTQTNGEVFWPKILQLSVTLDRPLLAKALSDFVISSPQRHHNATLIETLVVLAFQKRYTDFLSLYTLLWNRMSSAERVSSAPKLADILSRTPYWETGVDLYSQLSLPSVSILQKLCEGAAQFNSSEACRMVAMLPEFVGVPSDAFFDEFLRHHPTTADWTDNSLTAVGELFSIIKKKHWVVSVNAAHYIADWFKKTGSWDVALNVIIEETTCPACKTKLQVLELTDEYCKSLADEFFRRTFLGECTDDLYLATTPSELKSLRQFLSGQVSPFDCVIDFINAMCFLKIPFERNKAGIQFTEALRKLHHMFNFHRFCLVGRGNPLMKNKVFWEHIKQLGDQTGVSVFSFVTENKSQDDLFMLYMALWSGAQCYLVSNDQYRQHRYTVGPALKFKLSQWQSIRQINIRPAHGHHFLRPSLYDTRLHGSVEAGWHIPYEDKTTKRGQFSPVHWLCISPKH